MAQLDYRPVNAPDFSNSMQGITAANEMIQKAFGTALAGVNQYEGNQRDAASKELLNRMLAIRDPEAYKAAMAAGTLTAGIDNRLLGMDDLRSVEARAPQLISQAKNELEFNSFKAADERTRKQLAATDAAKPIMTEAFMLANNGDLAGANALIAKNMPTVGNLSFDQIKSFVSGNTSQADVSRRFGWASTDRNWELTQRDWTLEDRNTANAAVAAYQQVLDNSGNEQDAETFLRQQKFAPKVELAVRERLGLKAFPTFAPDPLAGFGTGGGGFGGADPLTIMNYEAKASGFPAVPDSVKTFGQASDFALQVNAANKARTGKPGSSAMGLYQIVGSTMRDYAPAAFGANWRNVDFRNAANQDKVAQKIWEDNNSSAEKIHNQWTSISVAEAKSLVGKPWNDQIRNAVAKGESGGNAAALVQASLGNAADKAVQDLNSADQVGSINAGKSAARFAELQLDQTPIASVVVKLKQSTFPDAPTDVLLSRVQEIQSRAKAQKVTLSAASAADILANSIKQRGFFDKTSDVLKTVLDPFALFTQRGGLGGNTEANYSVIDELIKDAVPKKNNDKTITTPNQDIIKDTAVLKKQVELRDQARDAVAAATAALMQTSAARAAGRNVDIEPYARRLQQANSMYVAAQRALTPTPEPVIAPPPAPRPQGQVQAAPAGPNSRFNPDFNSYAASQILPRGFGVMR